MDCDSKFMKDFEKACQEHIFALPPTQSKYICTVERSNRIFKKKFDGDLCEDTAIYA